MTDGRTARVNKRALRVEDNSFTPVLTLSFKGKPRPLLLALSLSLILPLRTNILREEYKLRSETHRGGLRHKSLEQFQAENTILPDTLSRNKFCQTYGQGSDS